MRMFRQHLRIFLMDPSQIPVYRDLLDLVIVTEKNNTLSLTERTSLSDLEPSFVRDALNFNLDLVLSERGSVVDRRRVFGKGGERYLVECDVVLDVFRFVLGFGVVPGNVLDGFAVDNGIVVRGGPEWGGVVPSVSLSSNGEVRLCEPFPWTDGAVCIREPRT